MAVSYAAWPVAADVSLLLSACNVTLRVTGADATERIARVRAEVAGEVLQRTSRQFLADSNDTTRTYDGSGSPEFEVDEMVSLTSARVIGLQSEPSYFLDNVVLVAEYTVPYTRIVTAKGSLPAFTTSVATYPYRTLFPAGRQNIQVTGKFGYAATIPQDLFEAVAGECAHRLALEVGWRPTGAVSERRAGDATVKFALADAGATGWHGRYERAIREYARPMGRRVRNLRPKMI